MFERSRPGGAGSISCVYQDPLITLDDRGRKGLIIGMIGESLERENRLHKKHSRPRPEDERGRANKHEGKRPSILPRPALLTT